MQRRRQHTLILLAGLWLGCTLLFHGCTSSGASAAGPTAAGAGATLWAQNCVRCHNLRPPDSYTESQWEVIVHHMRVRANLTAREHRVIIAWLKRGF